MVKIITRLLLMACIITLSQYVQAQAGSEKTAASQKSEIVFIENSWAAALKKAAETQKYIFVDAYTTWCGPCKMLKATTFRDKEAANFFNQNFVNLSLDMESGEGPAMAEKWKIEGYPTLIVFDPKGNMLLGTLGYIKAKELIKFGKKALEKKAT